MERNPDKFWNPYLAGAALGLVLLSAFVVMGKGLGASNASLRTGVTVIEMVAPRHVAATPALARTRADGHPLDNWLVFEVMGVLMGGFVGAYTSGRLKKETLRGASISAPTRWAMAFVGGVLMGAAAYMGRGCTSGQALTGGALLSVGSWIFMLSVFAGGYALAPVVRRAWR